MRGTLLAELRAQPQKIFDLNQIRKISYQLLTTLKFLDEHGMIHADIKPENVLVATTAAPLRPNIKLCVCDFGNAMKVDEVSMYFNTFDVQSLLYRSPEVCILC
jgi:serine/threonine protein kinase